MIPYDRTDNKTRDDGNNNIGTWPCAGYMSTASNTSNDGAYLASKRFIDTLENLLSMDYPRFTNVEKICIVDPDVTSSAAMVLSEFANDCGRMPVPLIKGSNIPAWVDDHTCAIVTSYYDDDQTVRCIEELIRRNTRIVCISKRGEASQLCDDEDIQFMELQDGLTLQEAVGSMVTMISCILQGSDVCGSKDPMMRSVGFLKEHIPLPRRTKKELTSIIKNIRGNNVLLISLSDLRGSSAVWKSYLSATIGEPIFNTELPEFDHNEIVGWCNENVNAENMLAVVIYNYSIHLLDVIVESATDVIADSGRNILMIRVDGSNAIERNLYGIMMSYHIAQYLEGQI